MNWLNSLIRKPPPPAPARATPKRTAAPKPLPVDTAPLREALATELEPAERARQELALGRALGASLQSPLPTDAPGVWAAAVSHGAEKSIALAWLEQISGDDMLGEIAANGRYAEVRLAAAQRITGSDALEAVARASKNKDKGVYRHCADLLRARREGQERLQQAALLAAGLRQLLERAPLSVSHLLELERAWKALAGAASHHDAGMAATEAPVGHEAAAAPDALQDCRSLLLRANARVLEEADAQRALHTLASGCDELAAQTGSTDWPAADVLAGWQHRHADLARALHALPVWLESSGNAQAVAAGLRTQAERLAAWQLDHERFAALAAFLDQWASGAHPDADAVAAWDAMAKPGAAQPRNAALARWQALQAPAAESAPTPVTPPEPTPVVPAAPAEPGPPLAAADLDTLRTQLEQLEQALEAGQLAHADAAAKLVKATLGPHGLEGRLDARLQRALARLGDLRGWAQWGATKKREDLIEAAQQLRGTVVSGAHNVEHLAVAIPALREEWKRLNAQGPAAKGQWESFDRALEAAYVPVAAFHAEESERRKQARDLREALLVQWEGALAAVDWGHPDPAALDALRESMLGQWRAAPHAGFRDERLMRTRFDALVRTLDQQVDAARAAEIQRREDLITAVAALAEVSDHRVASNQAKQLQERWRSEAGPMRLRRGEEQKLWQRFRAGCDVVFARRDAERAAQTAQRQERLQARAALLAAFGALLDGAIDGGADAAAPALKQALAQFRTDWAASTAESGASAAAVSGQERQARDLQQRAQRRIAELQDAALTARYAALAAAAALPEGVAAADLDKGRAAREELLIDLEIALGLATPGAGAELRRRRQLEQLQNRFRAGPAPAAREENPQKLLARWYATAALPNADHDSRMQAIVQALIERERLARARSDAEPARREHRPEARPGARTGARPGARPEQRTRRPGP